METIDIVRILLGPIEPVGETHTDDKRMDNLDEMCKVVDFLIGDIDKVAANKDRHEYSMKRAGEFAEKFLTNLGVRE